MRGLVFALAALSGLGACGKNDKPPPPSSGVHLTQESGPRPASHGNAGGRMPSGAQQVFASICQTCHGADGQGNGPAAETLNPKPRNYTDPAWQASVTDAEIKTIIVKGGAAVGKSALMPPNPTLEGDDETLDGLVKIIRGFAKQR